MHLSRLSKGRSSDSSLSHCSHIVLEREYRSRCHTNYHSLPEREYQVWGVDATPFTIVRSERHLTFWHICMQGMRDCVCNCNWLPGQYPAQLQQQPHHLPLASQQQQHTGELFIVQCLSNRQLMVYSGEMCTWPLRTLPVWVIAHTYPYRYASM